MRISDWSSDVCSSDLSFARLNRRISRSHLQDMAFDEDIEAYLDAWGIADREQRSLLLRVGRTAGTGGLGELKQILSNASLLAFEDGQELSHGHLRAAMAPRATSFLRNQPCHQQHRKLTVAQK